MKASYLWLSDFVDLTGVTPVQVAEILTQRGLEVEAIEPQAKGLDHVIVAKILERNKHPDSDRLSLCKVDTGKGVLEIVCGAQNMKAGDHVALAQVGADLPNGMKITANKIRGVLSHGMLCSTDELGLSVPDQKSEGILILETKPNIGQPLTRFLGLNDTVFDIKLTANRGDCLSHLGLARELSAALGRPLKMSSREMKSAVKMPSKSSKIKTRLNAGERANQFLGLELRGVKVGPSPEWLKKRLEAVGSRSINNVVDATNFVMLELGHPLHAYDSQKLSGEALEIREAKKGEVLLLLDGQSVTLSGFELVIADQKQAVALAGVMGGGNSEVSDSTVDLFLECAEFDPVLVRRAAFAHQRRTEAALRFEKGIDSQGAERAITCLAEVILEVAGGEVVGGSIAGAPVSRERKIELSLSWLNSFLGMKSPVQSKEAQDLLSRLGCEVKVSSEGIFAVTVPSFRLDLRIREDLAEEIARLKGYDQIDSTIPVLTTSPVVSTAEKNAFSAAELSWRGMQKAKDEMAAAGFNEALCYGFTSKKWLSEFGFKNPRCIVNPLSEEQEALVPSLIPGLVSAALYNWHHHFGSDQPGQKLFELRSIFAEGDSLQSSDPLSTTHPDATRLSFLATGPYFSQALKPESRDVDFFDLKGVVEGLIEALGCRGVRILPFSQFKGTPPALMGLFHPGKAACVLAGKDFAGAFGLLHPKLSKNLKFRAPVWAGELDWEALLKLAAAVSRPRTFKGWSDQPTIERDFALLVKGDLTADQIGQVALKAARPLAQSARVFDVYKGKGIPEGYQSVAVRLIFGDPTRALTEVEAQKASEEVLNAWKRELGVELRS